MTSEQIDERVKKLAVNNKVTCVKLLDLANELQIAPSEVGKSADRLKLKIISCQLGCFE